MEGASPVYGNSRARWYKDGRYYSHAGQEISAAEAALPEFEVEAAPEPVAEDTVPVYEYANPVIVEPVVVEPTIVVETGIIVSREDRLAAMATATIARLVRAAGGSPATGPGSRRLNIRWLLDHTTD